MPDTAKIPETAPGPLPDATPDTPTEDTTAHHAAAAAPARRPEPSVADTARLLAEHFPALFGPGVIKPIKLRIQADIHARAPGVFTRKALSFFLQRHTTATAYLRALVAEGATRTDLDGQPVGAIDAEHREAADAELQRRRAIVEARKQAGREAARAARRDARPPQPSRPPLPAQSSEMPGAGSHETGGRPATRGARPGQPGAGDRPERAPRPDGSGQARPRGRSPRPGDPRGSGRTADPGALAPRRPQNARPERQPAAASAHGPVDAPARSLTPEQAAEAEARHQRAVLLRSFEQSPLSKANFGALKGLSEADLDALLALARQERSAR